MNEIDKAERMQAWKAFLIPSSLFVACLFNAAGIYILYSGNTIGVFFVGMGFAIIVTGMFLFITFHNKQRADGKWKQVQDFTPPVNEPISQWGTPVDPSQITPVDPMPVYTPKPPTKVNR